jgi:hypothetical protein
MEGARLADFDADARQHRLPPATALSPA